MAAAHRAEVIGSLPRPELLFQRAVVVSRLKRRREAAAFIPLERLALSPQCGFASTQEGNLLTETDQEAKLALVAETAREVWGGS
jgi:methionine synthase II (cobalamin-independent)